MTYALPTVVPAPVEVARLDLPLLPPTVNHMYRSIGGGRRALTDDALTFRAETALALHGVPAPPSSAWLCLSVWFQFATKRRQDGDNRIKALQDAIALAWGIDDSRVIEWHIYTQWGRAPHTLAIVEVVQR